MKRSGMRRLALALLLLPLIALIIFFSLPGLLISEPRTTASDVIIHLAISPHSDADSYVASLYRQKVAGRILCVSSPISWEVYPADYARQHLIELGVPPEAVLTLHQPIAACEAQNLPRLVEFVSSNGWRTATLVVKPSDSRATARLVGRYFNRAGIATAVTYSPQDDESLKSGWWRTHWKAQQMIDAAANVALDALYPECW
ncbi:MAG: hypothetical protein U0Z53_24940 [Blastocatellia bacterium]